MSYRAIKPDSVIGTIDRLTLRIRERFAGRGLAQVCAELGEVARRDRDRVAALRRPNVWVRAGVLSVAALLALSLGLLLKEVKLPSLLRLWRPGEEAGAVITLLQGVDSAVNIGLLFGAGLFFLLRHEERDKRRRALEDLYELRALAHVIDMHQLTKDPTTLLAPDSRTASSPVETMTPFELARYLDYCSEMLSLVAKVAAFYAQDMRDPVVIESVSDLEAMTTNLSRKIWQKIMIVEQASLAAARTP
ncbi:MAG: hypothetical protein NW200_09510 [Hyphomonadaceae bacterium]|nr:hypothetical protein [Hyphomonadaceae bacterium]